MHPHYRSSLTLLGKDLPKPDGNSIDFYYWFHGTEAMLLADGPRGSRWKQWNIKLKSALVPLQNGSTEGCKAGSWETFGRWTGEGGRVYATALNTLTLESFYRLYE